MNSMKQTYTEANPGVESLVKEHMELVRKIAWHMHGRVRNAVEIDDLLQVGYFGLVMGRLEPRLRGLLPEEYFVYFDYYNAYINHSFFICFLIES